MRLPKVRQYPRLIRLGDDEYTVKFVRKFKDPTTVGECDPGDRVISIKLGLGPVETFKTFVHEVLHLLEFEKDLPIKHSLIYKLEEAICQLFLQNF